MRWFKHQTAAHSDVKLKKLILRQGMAAYGLYWYCLELIGKDVSESKLTFEIEEDSELLAHGTGMTREQVESAMHAMVDLGLFTNVEGRVFCVNMLRYIDASMFKAGKIRESFQEHKDKILSGTGLVHVPHTDRTSTIRAEHNKTGQDITEQNICASPAEIHAPFDRFWDAYPRKTNKQQARKAFGKIKVNVDDLINDIEQRLASGHWSTDDKEYIPHPSTYLNQARWEDEIITPKNKPMDAQSVAARTQALLSDWEDIV